MIPDSENMNQYNVLVDVAVSALDMDEIAELFSHAIHVEEIGQNQYQIGLGVFSPGEREAYRRAVNVVESELACLNCTGPSVLSAAVYGPDKDGTTSNRR